MGDPLTSHAVDSENYVAEGLTPSTKNIRKRKFRKRPQIPVRRRAVNLIFQRDSVIEAQKEILSLQKGGRARDFEIEEIPVEEVLAYSYLNS